MHETPGVSHSPSGYCLLVHDPQATSPALTCLLSSKSKCSVCHLNSPAQMSCKQLKCNLSETEFILSSLQSCYFSISGCLRLEVGGTFLLEGLGTPFWNPTAFENWFNTPVLQYVISLSWFLQKVRLSKLHGKVSTLLTLPSRPEMSSHQGQWPCLTVFSPILGFNSLLVNFLFTFPIWRRFLFRI